MPHVNWCRVEKLRFFILASLKNEICLTNEEDNPIKSGMSRSGKLYGKSVKSYKNTSASMESLKFYLMNPVCA